MWPSDIRSHTKIIWNEIILLFTLTFVCKCVWRVKLLVVILTYWSSSCGSFNCWSHVLKKLTKKAFERFCELIGVARVTNKTWSNNREIATNKSMYVCIYIHIYRFLFQFLQILFKDYPWYNTKSKINSKLTPLFNFLKNCYGHKWSHHNEFNLLIFNIKVCLFFITGKNTLFRHFLHSLPSYNKKKHCVQFPCAHTHTYIPMNKDHYFLIIKCTHTLTRAHSQAFVTISETKSKAHTKIYTGQANYSIFGVRVCRY